MDNSGDKYSLWCRWSASTAGWEYVLGLRDEEGVVTKILSYGDRAWAERHAKHYGIEMPKEGN